MPKDSIYQRPRSPVPPFEFNEQVAGVFDDMLRRSIPFYDEIIRRQVQLIARLYQPGTVIYDLGCSNGNLGIALCREMAERPFQMVAVDNAAPMIQAYERRLGDLSGGRRITLLCRDICGLRIENASVAAVNFTLQFIAPGRRDAMIETVYKGLVPGGALLLCEKVTHQDPFMERLQQDFYHGFKQQNGYSELEISQKREALDKVLIPEPLEVHLKRLRRCGFNSTEIWLKWFNFTALLAIK